MALPLLGVLVIMGRSLSFALRRWQGILALTGLVAATGFTFNSMLRQAGETALSLWPMLALACLCILLREFIKGWVRVKEGQITVSNTKGKK